MYKSLGLRSAYKTVNGQEPPVTNAKGISTVEPDGFKGCLDYIFYSPGLFAVDVVSLDMVEDLTQEGGGLPNSESPSDHIPLGAVFRIATLDSPTSVSCVPSNQLEMFTTGATDMVVSVTPVVSTVAAMEIPTAKNVLPIVRPLPVGWEAHVDPATHDLFYYNITTGITRWDPPECNIHPSTDVFLQGLSGSHAVLSSSSSSSSSTSGHHLVSTDIRGDVIVAVKHLNKEEPAAGPSLTNVTVNQFSASLISILHAYYMYIGTNYPRYIHVIHPPSIYLASFR